MQIDRARLDLEILQGSCGEGISDVRNQLLAKDDWVMSTKELERLPAARRDWKEYTLYLRIIDANHQGIPPARQAEVIYGLDRTSDSDDQTNLGKPTKTAMQMLHGHYRKISWLMPEKEIAVPITSKCRFA